MSQTLLEMHAALVRRVDVLEEDFPRELRRLVEELEAERRALYGELRAMIRNRAQESDSRFDGVERQLHSLGERLSIIERQNSDLKREVGGLRRDVAANTEAVLAMTTRFEEVNRNLLALAARLPPLPDTPTA